MRRPRNTDPLDEPLLTPAEAAALLGVSAAEVRRLVEAGRLPAFRLGYVVRVHPQHVRRLAARAPRAKI